jgi:hypothetical protein
MRKKAENKILFAAQNPGGLNALMPVIKKTIEAKNYQVKVCLAEDACVMAKRLKLNFTNCAGISRKELERLLNKFQPDIAFIATSDGLSLEKKITAWAKNNGIKTLSIIDFWANYKQRFSAPGTLDLAYLPDMICVIDESMKREMIKEGFNARRLIITGNPFFESFSLIKQDRGKYILYADQPFSEIGAKGGYISSPTFNEVEIFSDYVKVLEKLNIKMPIIIAFHPRSKKRNKYNKIIAKSKLKISIAKTKTDDLIKAAEIVAGINTMVLFQAAISGKKVVSYQPGIIKKQDPLKSNLLGLSCAAYNFRQLEKQLNKALSRTGCPPKHKKTRDKYVFKNSTQRAINVINKLINN